MQMTSKKLSIILLTVVLAAAAWIGFFQPTNVNGNVKAQENGSANNQTITVTGNGEIMVDPDVSYVQVTVETKGETAEQSQNENAKIMADVEKVLYETYNLDEEDVKTARYNVQPQYQYIQDKEPKLLGYKTSHSLQITYRDIDEIGKLVDDLTKAGVNRVDNIQFGTEKADEYELKAIEKAMANAKEKAATIAKTENKTIKGIVHVVQGGASSIDPLYGATAKMYALESEAAPTSISTGQISIKTQVTVQYEF
ncbi:SIMPL domain-containing protein [Chengkuizengella axinellae]|uniref:SIMPL domain-containing protein n=1 Tax=Chengkuizengella axinellae TaxID=3064388 RepID=A0ABT9J2Z0_9BACL|nr:SIMPL domain-containing protein [Chengkuizengella sp. 2205SS18-9]MDP5275833.1 SIMPL domain-containing protein [Chengkuizengella sp. 2205SS18-9]